MQKHNRSLCVDLYLAPLQSSFVSSNSLAFVFRVENVFISVVTAELDSNALNFFEKPLDPFFPKQLQLERERALFR